jgi:hypothetical protein
MKRAVGLFLVALIMIGAHQPENLAGEWELVADASTPVDPFRNLALDVRIDGASVVLVRTWMGSDNVRGVDSLRVVPGEAARTVPMQFWLDNRHLGVRVGPDSTRQVSARWKDDHRTLAVEQQMTVASSQGATPLRIYSEYRSTPDGNTLEVIELRSTRPRPMSYVFRRSGGGT